MPKANKMVQQKILAHPWAVKFLEALTFDFSGAETLELRVYNAAELEEALT